MSFATIHKLDKVVMPSSVEFTQIHSARWGAEITSMVEHQAGHTDPTFRSNQESKPVLEFATSQLETVLANLGVAGATVGSTATYFKLATTIGSDPRASTTHQKVTISSSLGYWTTIRLPHRGRAEANVVMSAIFDGTNDPFVYSGSQALSGNLLASTAVEYWAAGPVSINGTEIEGIQEIEVASGIQLIEAGGASEIWDRFKGVQIFAPIVTIRTFKMVNWGSVDIEGTALNGSTGITFYARKKKANGSNVIDGTAEHIKFVGAYGSAIPVDSNGEETGPITDTLRCELIAPSDSVRPLVGTINSAIT